MTTKKPGAKPALKKPASPKAKASPLKVVRDPMGVPKVQRQDVAGPAAVRLPDGGVKMVDKDMQDAVAARVAEKGTEKSSQLASVPAVVKPNDHQDTKPKTEKAKAEKLGDVETVQIEARILAAALHCAAKGDVRYYLNGVHVFEHRENVLRVQATNGHVLFVHDYPVEKVPAWAKGAGVVINRDNLGKAVGAAGKDDGVVLELSSGIGHPHVTVATWPDQWATFRLEIFDSVKFPDTEKIAEGAAGTLSHDGERTPLDTTAIDANYFKLATVVAQSLNIPGVQAYMGDGKSAAVFTFGVRRAALYVMPIRDGGALSVQAASVLAPAITRSLGALRAHQTRNEIAAKSEKDPERARELRETAMKFSRRIKDIMSAANEGKALPAPAAKKAA